jgi:hypothetical protein
MTPRERAYIFRIAAILEMNEGPQGVQNLTRALRDLNTAWDDRAITAAVAYVRASILRIPFTTVQFDVAA